jgi:leucyl-tRNA synthetase
MDGTRRWLDRVWRLFTELDKISDENDGSLDKVYNQTVKKVSHDIDALKLNTAISQMMIFINECYRVERVYRRYAEGFVQLFACFAPHLGEELWQMLTKKDSIAYLPWPTVDESKLIDDEVEIVIQVNGKIRGKMWVDLDTEEEELKALAVKVDTVIVHIEGKPIRKLIAIKNKIVNIVV